MAQVTKLMAIAVALCGCGTDGSTGSTGPGVVQGTVHGATIQIASVFSAAVSTEMSGTPFEGAAIVMSTSGNTCADLRANAQHPSTTYVSIFLADRPAGTLTLPREPGEYTVFADVRMPPPKLAGIAVVDVDASCAHVGAQLATAASGTVDLASLDGDIFGGTFDVTLTTGERLSGDFAPTACPGIETFETSQASPTCHP